MQQTGYYEIIRHTVGDAGLPFRVILGNVQFNRLHWHDSLEIFCCIHGNVHIKTGHTELSLGEEDLMTIGCGVVHEISEGTPNGLQLIFSVEPSLLRLSPTEEYALSTVGENALPKEHTDIQAVRTSIARMACLLYFPEDRKPPPVFPVFQNTKKPEETSLFKQNDLPEKGGFSDERWYGLHRELYQILLCLSRYKRQAATSARPKKTYERFIQCVELLHQTYDKPISAAFFANKLGFSEPTVYRLFQQHMGVSFNEYLNSVRISAACCLIAESDQSITEIASQCGYNSLSNFYRAFHQLVGCSPREYRQNRNASPWNPEGVPWNQEGVPWNWEGFSGSSMQYDLLRLNRFQHFGELPYSYEELKALAKIT